MTETRPLLIWDFDGTLADSYALVESLLLELAPSYRIAQPTPEQIQAMRGKQMPDILAELGLKWTQVPGLLLKVQSRMRKQMKAILPFAGLVPVLRELAQSYRCVVISSNSQANVEAWLTHHGIADVFELVAGGSSLRGKAAHFKKVAKKMKVPLARIVAIGDEIRDVDAAREAGIGVVVVGWGFQSAEGLREAGHTPVMDVEALPRAIAAAV